VFITEEKLLAMQMRSQGSSLERIIGDLIKEHKTDKMVEGVKYYHNENEILDRKITYFDENGNEKVDLEAINHQVPHNWHKLLVDQKVSYLLGKPLTVSAEPEEFQKLINEHLDEEFDDKIKEVGKNSSNKGVEYLHPYINEAGEFKFVILPAEQVIPIYDTDYQETLVGFIRYYPVYVNEEKRLRAEFWTKEDVTYYVQDPSGLFQLESMEGQDNPSAHYYIDGTGYGWDAVPLIEFRNNEERYPDLKYYKKLIDVYDMVVSDMTNDLAGVQKLIYVLRGYGGQDLNEFMANLRYYRAIKTDGQGGVDLLQADIPVEAIEKYLEKAEENIFLFGQGANIKTDRFGQSPSGVALKFIFHLLDQKADTMARKFSFAIKGFIWFLKEYLSITGQYTAPEGALNSVHVTFNKSMLVNELEKVQIALQSEGLASRETRVANHPWVENEHEELKKLDEEEADGPIDLDEEE